MTNEKAITLVNDAFGGYYSEWAGTFTEAEKDELAEANRMAIEALEQASTAIPLDWINGYINWLNSISTAMAAADVNAIKSMLTKWKLDKNGPVCGPDYCEIGGEHND